MFDAAPWSIYNVTVGSGEVTQWAQTNDRQKKVTTLTIDPRLDPLDLDRVTALYDFSGTASVRQWTLETCCQLAMSSKSKSIMFVK
jgi:hypothetical protein